VARIANKRAHKADRSDRRSARIERDGAPHQPYIVLELIRANQPISRADLSRSSGLQRSTVSQIVEQLIQEKWCARCHARPAGAGQRCWASMKTSL